MTIKSLSLLSCDASCRWKLCPLQVWASLVIWFFISSQGWFPSKLRSLAKKYDTTGRPWWIAKRKCQKHGSRNHIEQNYPPPSAIFSYRWSWVARGQEAISLTFIKVVDPALAVAVPWIVQQGVDDPNSFLMANIAFSFFLLDSWEG